MAHKRKRRRGRRFSKAVVIAVILLNILFTVAVFLTFWHTGNEPTALVAAWFAFTTGELSILGMIEKNKNEKDE